ncbi:hypothetical protein DL1_13385 [Thioclava dalianensis]|uniref:Lipoprotein n=1 Tax=Thioclava dalianensis TaxID=1185766 RepID=A0A074TH15_9RHOB|nr:hypothetical protein [Thioclava dalianensis]KEP70959.1 hypothetical protein DL1_13385 [Thioclava dalianensis]SFN11430.1 hypothetical protein SAMN05216224_102470 [Thioclava dalianensis]
MRLWMILPLVLAGCAAGARAPSWPDQVTIHRTDMRVSFNDGTVCRADIAQAPSGKLQGCRWPMAYTVRDYKPSVIGRAGALSEIFEPYAKITLSAPSGMTWHFETPPPIPATDHGEGTLNMP